MMFLLLTFPTIRLAPLPGAENNNKPGVQLPSSLTGKHPSHPPPPIGLFQSSIIMSVPE
jgi:hypothetical protein